MLLPTFAQFVEAGSHCKLNINNFMRTASVNTAAFTIMDFHTEFFAVPIRQLMSTWGVFRTRTNDLHSTKFTVPNVRIPALKTDNLQNALLDSSLHDSLGYSFREGAVRLLDMLNYGAIPDYGDSHGIGFNSNVDLNPFFLLAYQKVYFDHFRNTSYEANDPSAYNIDQFVNADGTVTPISNVLDKVLCLRYVDYRKDMFSNIYPSLYYIKSGNLQGVHFPSSIIGLQASGSNAGLGPYMDSSNSDRLFVSGWKSVRNSANTGTDYVSNTFTTQNIRVAFAVDKLLRLSAYAPQHVVDQYQARFGVKPIGENLGESLRLGSFKSDIIIGEVTSTANTQIQQTAPNLGDGLGAIGGKGIGSSDYGKPISYNANEDCIIIGVSYVLPRMVYDSNAIDAFNFKFVPEDYVVPEMMDMGLQPLFLKQMRLRVFEASDPSSSYDNYYNVSEGNRVLGYQPRYSEYKLGVDRNHGLFNEQYPLSPFTVHSRSQFVPDQSAQTGVTYVQLKADPKDLDSIFVEDYDGQQFHDQFFGTMQFAFACIQNLSVHGESNL